MVKKFFIGAILILTSSLTQASLIEYNGYSRDSSSNIVTGGGLEWLMWDVTMGMSINSALAAYSVDGWALASNIQMADLFNVFQFGKTDWLADEGLQQSAGQPYGSITNHDGFITLFGHTYLSQCELTQSSGCYSRDNPYIISRAIYGSDANGDSLFNLARVSSDALILENNFQSFGASLSRDLVSNTEVSSFTGIALVRKSATVPAPNTFGILVLGIAALLLSHHRFPLRYTTRQNRKKH